MLEDVAKLYLENHGDTNKEGSPRSVLLNPPDVDKIHLINVSSIDLMAVW